MTRCYVYMTPISATIEFNFFIEIKNELFCVLIFLWFICGSVSVIFLSHCYLDPDIGGVTETLA